MEHGGLLIDSTVLDDTCGLQGMMVHHGTFHAQDGADANFWGVDVLNTLEMAIWEVLWKSGTLASQLLCSSASRKGVLGHPLQVCLWIE